MDLNNIFEDLEIVELFLLSGIDRFEFVSVVLLMVLFEWIRIFV